MSMHSEYIARMETQLKKWDAHVDALATEGKKASADARAAYDERIKDSRASRAAAQENIPGGPPGGRIGRCTDAGRNARGLGNDARGFQEGVF
jgi:hypothetical protein